MNTGNADSRVYDAVVVGAGFAGLYLLHKLRQSGFTAIAVEAGKEVGGTWYWNRYPGARCDVESIEYQLGWPEFLQQEWTWSERYATQPEIERYLRFVTERLDLSRDIVFSQRVLTTRYDQALNQWILETDTGSSFAGRFCLMATGCISIPLFPSVPGSEEFKGRIVHTGDWPAEGLEFTGKRVAVIGTGSSGVQVIPLIAEQAERLFVMQRTPNYVFPAFNRPLEQPEVNGVKKRFTAARLAAQVSYTGTAIEMNPKACQELSDEEREAEFERRWQLGGGFVFLLSYRDLLTNLEANAYAADFVRRKIRAVIKDPELAEKLVPRGYPIGTKRICLGTDYYETYLRPNVTLVDVRANAIRRITASGLLCGDTEYPVDVIVFATGFGGITGALTRVNVQGPHGSLADKWRAGARSYLGLTVAGFPNFFTVTGPGSPSVLSNVVVSVEQHVDWIVQCMNHMRDRAYTSIEATESAEADWVSHVNELASYTLYSMADSWYLGANVPGKPRIFLPYVGGVGPYRLKCDEVTKAGYAGFEFHRQ